MSLWNSLRFKMPTIVLFGVIPPMLGAIFYASYRADIRLRQDAKQNIASQAELVANTILWWNQMNVLNLQQLSQLPDIVSMDAKRQKPILNNLVATNPQLYVASTVNLDGWNVARSDGSKSIYYGDRPWFLEAKVGKKISYQTLISRTLNKPAMCLGAPIQPKPSELAGVAMLCTQLTDLAAQLGKLQFGATGYTILVDQTGHVLAHPNSALISDRELHNLNRYPPVKHILEGREGFFTFTDYQDIGWVSHGISLENGWKITIVQQQAEFFKNEHEFKTLAFIVGLVAAISVSILTWLLANYLIQPISELTKAATAISKGKLGKRLDIKRHDEIGIMAKAFNLMASRLKTSFAELEYRVRKRTSELNKAKKEAEQANQTKDRFLARISHELRSPLNTIISYATILQKKPELMGYSTQTKLCDSSQKVRELNIIRESGIHLLNLVEDILDFSKAKAQKIELNPTCFDLQSFLNGILAMVDLKAQEKQLILEYEIENNLNKNNLNVRVWADQKKLQQVLINLLNNAIKFTNQGQITLKVTVLKTSNTHDANNSSLRQELRFEVIDTGVGISSKYLEKIFQPFEQVSTSEENINGTGLGLSISKEIVALLGSELKVDSKLGIGSIFWFDISLPGVKVTSETDQEPIFPSQISVNNPQETVPSLNLALDLKETVPSLNVAPELNEAFPPLSLNRLKSKILIVDDKEENYLMISNILTPLGFELFSAVNGKQALDVAALVEPDLILLDLFMPVKTGFTLVRDLQKMPQFETTPVILISSCNYQSLRKASNTYNCQGFLTKPIDEKKLLALLKELGMYSQPEDNVLKSFNSR